MNKITIALLASALCIPAMVFGQQAQQDNQQLKQQQMNQSSQEQSVGVDTAPHHMMSGTVSNAGENFINGDTTYVVANPDKLKGYDNQSVSIKFQFDTDSNQIHIDSVTAGQPQ